MFLKTSNRNLACPHLNAHIPLFIKSNISGRVLQSVLAFKRECLQLLINKALNLCRLIKMEMLEMRKKALLFCLLGVIGTSSAEDQKIDGSLSVNGELDAARLLINDPNIPENWDDIWQSGFFDGRDLPNSPEIGHTFWGINMGNSDNYKYGEITGYKNGAQIVIRNSPSFPTMYIRSRFADGSGTWGKVLASGKDGRYGIGTDKPLTALTVSGEGNPNSTISINGINNTSAGLNLFNDGYVKWYVFNRADKDNSFRISSKTHLGLTISQDGQVGIGTDRYSDYKLSVAGNIRAEGVKVEKGWADYVFEDNYNLLTLSQVKDSIELNGHLPGMKSAEEVAASGGFEIGETAVKLLEKIEELTLYSIDLHTENNSLKQQNEHLTSTVSELTEKVAQFDDLKNRIDALEHSLNTENSKLK